MKKNIKNLLIVILCLFAFSCSEDKGNYDYTMINTLEIKGLPKDTSMVKLSVLNLSPKFARNLEAIETGLEYSWTFAGKEVSKERDLSYEIPTSALPGKVDCRYIVTDTKTGMKYFYTFSVNIVSPFGWGYYFFCEGDNKQSLLSYWNVAKGTTECITTSKIGDYELGSEPVMLAAAFGNIESLDGYYWAITAVSKKGANPVIVTDNGAFMPTSLINASSGLYEMPIFEPAASINMRTGHQYFLSDNKVYRYASGFLYRNGHSDKNYKWSHVASDYTAMFAFDELTKKFYILKNQLNDPVNGLIYDSNALDRVVSIADQPDYNGHRIIGMKAVSSTEHILTLFTTDGNSINLIELTYIDQRQATEEEPAIFESGKCTKIVNMPVSGGVGENATLISITNDWYFGIGNKIYSSPNLLPALSNWTELPSNLGEITAMTSSGAGKKIVVAMYDKNSSASKKGSFVIIDLLTKEKVIHANVIDKCVSVGGYNSDPWGFGLGDNQ